MLLTVTSLFGQQTEGLKIVKEGKMSMERKIPVKKNDSLAKNNLNDILKQNTPGGHSILGTANPYHSEVQNNVNRLQNNVSSFNNSSFERIAMPQGQGIQLNKRK